MHLACGAARGSFGSPADPDEPQAIAVGQQFERLLGLDQPGFKRQPYSINVGLPEPSPKGGGPKFSYYIFAPAHAALRTLA
jgi:hypothetical protein